MLEETSVAAIMPESLRAQLTALLERGQFAEVADQCRQRLGPTPFYQLIRAKLGAPAAPPEVTHRPIVGAPWACIVTTNFDTLLEDAYARWSDRGVPRTPTGTELQHHGTLLLDGGFFILKAHGTLEDESSMVFTTDDYRRITHANPAFNQMLSAILLGHAVLFVGYSLSDPNFRLLLEAQLSTFGAEVPRRYLLAEAVGEAEEELLWRTARVRVLPYPKGQLHHVARFLSALQAACVAPARPGETVRSRPRRRTVARPDVPHTVLRVELAAHQASLEVSWRRVTVLGCRPADLTSTARVARGSGVLPPWPQLRRVFYQRLFAGQPAADAFWAARGDTYRSNPDAYSFLMSGYPDLVLCPRARTPTA